jgi:hypothetical protein
MAPFLSASSGEKVTPLGEIRLVSGRAILLNHVGFEGGNALRLVNVAAGGGQFTIPIPGAKLSVLREVLSKLDDKGRIITGAVERPTVADDDVASAPILFRIPARSGKAAP